MKKNLNLKAQIIELLIGQIDKKIVLLKQTIQAARESRDNETKSSVGDKYETGRAMVQMELEKNQVQLSKTEAFKSSLLKIDLHKINDVVEFGSLVYTAQDNYFISIPFGKIKIDETSVFCISPVSPVGKMLLGKQVGDKVPFQGKEIVLTEIY